MAAAHDPKMTGGWTGCKGYGHGAYTVWEINGDRGACPVFWRCGMAVNDAIVYNNMKKTIRQM
jgi:hypothetical protein